GDSIGFYAGHRVGSPLFDWLGRKFPRHFGPSHVVVAERFFTRHGAWAVFFGRFIALLRIFSGPLAGSLHMPYGRFLLANASGGIIWATGITYLIWFLGQAAEKWLSRASWIGLLAALAAGLAVTLLIRRRASKLAAQHQAESAAEQEAEASSEAGSSPKAESAAAGRDEPAAASAEAESSPETEASAEAETEASTEASAETKASAPAEEVPSPAEEEEAGLTAGHGQARLSAANGEARLPTGNGKAPSARQRTASDR
ncbi:MAG TPA: DedA family protein, partial [Streptosporangiaceae bacterium]|nr:DedA family protein [Streptosporangiaceae bacterium]